MSNATDEQKAYLYATMTAQNKLHKLLADAHQHRKNRLTVDQMFMALSYSLEINRGIMQIAFTFDTDKTEGNLQ